MLLLLLACNGNENDSGPEVDTSVPVDDTCETDDDCSSTQICEDEDCVTGDRNNSIDEAESILWDNPVGGTLETDGDQDFYAFTAEGGEYIRVQTTSDDEEMDTIVSLYTPSGKLHAQENDHALGSVQTYDTVLYAYLPTAGDYTLLVEDVEGNGATSFDYELELTEFNNYVQEDDSSGSAGEEIDVEAGYFYAVGFVLDEDSDKDWIQLNLPYDECPVLVTGPTYPLNSDATPVVDLYDHDGELLLRKSEPVPGDDAFYFEVDGGTALIGVEDASGGGSADHWGFVYVRVYDQGYHYPYEQEPNDDDSEASNIEFTWEGVEGDKLGTGLVWGIMDFEDDEDWFAVDVEDGNYLYVNGTADSFGSLIDAEATLWNDQLEVVASGDSTGQDDNFSDIGQLGPLDGGTYYIQITDDNAGEGQATYYRFTAFQSDYSF
ncbi:MAG: hypothetical protein GY913_13345 [Proteobacteria bacterium]|nr:hypothetical protein [Pseudomonadota bacterium]MCP4917892.1 hypothetical protein [Pseudomonadota bacterium]